MGTEAGSGAAWRQQSLTPPAQFGGHAELLWLS